MSGAAGALGALAAGRRSAAVGAADSDAPLFELVQPELFGVSGGQPSCWADFNRDGFYDLFVGFKDGWFLIRNGSDDGLKLDAAHAEDGRGWISARLVGVQLRVPALRSAPRREAREIAHLRGENWGPDSVTVSAVHACQGPYMEVTTTPYGGKVAVRGWSYKPCSLQLTTCDGGVTE